MADRPLAIAPTRSLFVRGRDPKQDLARIEELARPHPTLWRLVQAMIVVAWQMAQETPLRFAWGLVATRLILMDLSDGKLDGFLRAAAVLNRLV